MNSFLISKKYFLIFLLISCLGLQIFAQGVEQGFPFIRNISPLESGFKGDNYSIIQDHRGIMYFGNYNGLLEYDGVNWRLIPINGKPIFAKTTEDKIYVGAFNQLYFLTPHTKGEIGLVPMLDSANFGQIQSIFAREDKVLFSNKNTLYLYDNTLQKLFSDQTYVHIFANGNTFLINFPDSGIMVFDMKRMYSVKESKFFINKELKGIIPLKNKYLAITESEVFMVTPQNVTKLNNSFANFISNNYRCFATLSNNNIAIGTNNNGIIIINQNCDIISIINRENGLYDNQVNSFLVDRANSLWAAFSNGLARIETPSAYSYFGYNNGIKGQVTSIVRYKKSLYVSTSEGVYIQKPIQKIDEKGKEIDKCFVRYENMTNDCRKLIVSNGQLLAGTTNGLFSIAETPKLILSGQISTLQTSVFYQDIIYAAVGNSILTLQLSGNKWTTIGGLKGFKSVITSIAESKEGMLWIGTRNEGVYSITFDDRSFHNSHIIQYKDGHGLPKVSDWIDVCFTQKGVMFSTGAGLYRFDYFKKVFVKDSLIDFNSETNAMRVNPIMEDNNKNLWMSFESENTSQKPILFAWNVPNVQRYACISEPFNRIKDFICETIYPDSGMVVWFGGFNGLVCLDFKKLREENAVASTLIRKISINKDSVLYFNTENRIGDKAKTVSISYRNRNIKVEFATPVFEKNNELLHQCKLDGFDKDWSPFSVMSSKEYTNLSPGEYVFRVRAKNLFENVSKEAVFRFTIEKPFFMTYYAMSLYLFILIAFINVLMRWRTFQFSFKEINLMKIIDERTEEYFNEKEKTESILANILPEQTVKDLKDSNKTTTRRYKMVTVLFTDIQGFTKIAETMSPDVLVDELDNLFIRFDRIIEKYNIEKIKTIGDAYMCAGGIPEKNRTNPVEIVLAALEMQYCVRGMQLHAEQENTAYWSIRIGVNTGPVIAGVIGRKKFTYDIWGDTVNIANRMETAGEVNMVNISEDTYLLINEYFDCIHRGKMPIKYKGEIDMYFVKGLKLHLTEDFLRITPNKAMKGKLDLLRFDDLEEFMFDKLENELPKNLYYHSVKHTIDVVVHVEVLALEENVSDDELFLLKTAALFHDSGFLKSMHDHESMSVEVAEDILPGYGFNRDQRAIIADLILATRMPHNPKTKLEQIICDADLDYLGRPDYLNVSRNLFHEMVELKMIKNSEYDWNKLQLKFMQNHKFFTESAKRRRNLNKSKQLEKIITQDFKFESEKQNKQKL